MNNINKVLEYSINKDFINNLINKNYEFIKKKIKGLPIITHSIQEEKNESFIIISNQNRNDLFFLEQFISLGSYNKTYQIKNDKNERFVYRIKNTVVNDREALMENFLQIFIYAYLNEYQNKYLKEPCFIKIHNYGFNKIYKFCSTIVEKMNGNLFLIISNKDLSFENKLKVIIKALYKISILLEKLQKDLYFVHNDLKCDNVFFKFKNSELEKLDLYNTDNLIFYFGDFDTCHIEIYNQTLMCKNSYFPNRNFSSKRDLFMLINSLFYTLNDFEWRSTFFKYFPVVENVANNNTNYYKLYHFIDNQIIDIYKPKNFIKLLEKTFPDFI